MLPYGASAVNVLFTLIVAVSGKFDFGCKQIVKCLSWDGDDG